MREILRKNKTQVRRHEASSIVWMEEAYVSDFLA
jgi:hypothetical protein